MTGADLDVYPGYEKYRKRIQALSGLKGNANGDDFNFEVILEDGTIVRAYGGVSVMDAPEFGFGSVGSYCWGPRC